MSECFEIKNNNFPKFPMKNIDVDFLVFTSSFESMLYFIELRLWKNVILGRTFILYWYFADLFLDKCCKNIHRSLILEFFWMILYLVIQNIMRMSMGHKGRISMDTIMHATMDFENLNNLLEHTVYLPMLHPYFQ